MEFNPTLQRFYEHSNMETYCENHETQSAQYFKSINVEIVEKNC